MTSFSRVGSSAVQIVARKVPYACLDEDAKHEEGRLVSLRRRYRYRRSLPSVSLQ